MQVYEFLKELIIKGDILPGERLIEEKIAKELQVSRSPIREAITMLAMDGLVFVNSTGGVTVINPTLEDYTYLYECRVELEPLAAFYAAKRRTEEQLEIIRASLKSMIEISKSNNLNKVHDSNVNFHEPIVIASANPFLISMVSQIRGVNSFYRKSIVDEYPYHVDEAILEHTQIFQAIAIQDADKAKELMRKHIENDYLLFLKRSSQSD